MIKEDFMTKENVPDTHKLLEHLDVLVTEYNGKLQVFFKLPDLYRLFTSKDFETFTKYKRLLEKEHILSKKHYVQNLSKIARPHCQRMHRVLKNNSTHLLL